KTPHRSNAASVLLFLAETTDKEFVTQNSVCDHGRVDPQQRCTVQRRIGFTFFERSAIFWDRSLYPLVRGVHETRNFEHFLRGRIVANKTLWLVVHDGID